MQNFIGFLFIKTKDLNALRGDEPFGKLISDQSRSIIISYYAI